MKDKIKKNALGSIASVLGLAALLTCALSPASATAQNPLPQNPGALEGGWYSNVTIQDCQSGNVLTTFQGLGVFHPDGVLEQNNNISPILGKLGLGHWQSLGGRHYTATFLFFRFDSTGVWTGTQKVTRDIQLDNQDRTFTSVISFTTFDVNGNPIATGCGTETATRVGA